MGFYNIDTGESVSRTEIYREQGEAAIKAARQLEEKAKAESRAFTPGEQAEYDRHVTEAKQSVAAMKSARADEEFVAGVGQMFGGGIDVPAGSSKGNNRLSFKGLAGALARQIQPDGVKALAPSGAAVVGQEFTADPVALGKPALSLLEVIPVVQHSSPEFAYLRQTTRTNNAAVVAAGALKPTSVYTVTRIENALVVIAHLSEGIPRHWLIDNTSLETFLDGELRYGLQAAVEAKVLADVNGTSGTQVVAYATSVLTTLRKGITKLETAGYTASAFVLHPTDWEGVELALSAQSAVEHMGLPYDPATRRLFGVPVVTTNAQAAGVGHVVATDSVALDTDTRGVDVQWSENATADSFGKNLVFARCESRYATSVFSPLGVVTLDLTA